MDRENIENFYPYPFDACERCGRGNHLLEDCFATKNIFGFDVSKYKPYPKDSCQNCGLFDHRTNNCYVEFDIYGDRVGDFSFEY